MEQGDFKFNIGDIVEISDVGDMLFQVIGISEQYYMNEGQDDYSVILYKCMSVDDPQDVEYFHENDLILIQTAETYKLTQTPDPVNSKKKEKDKPKKTKQVKKKNENIDELLDKLNDYKMLYETFGDGRFKTIITNTIKKLTELSAQKEG